MEVWGESENEFGTCTFMAGPATVPLLAKLLDPDAPLVYLEAFAPLLGFQGNTGWAEVSLPLGPRLVENVRARELRFDALVPTTTFLAAAPDLADLGLRCLQVRHEPPDGSHERRIRDPVGRHRWYERVGLVIAFDLPHRNESAEVTTLNTPDRDAAIARLLG